MGPATWVEVSAPVLFIQKFPRDVNEYLDQVDSLKKAKAASKPQSSGFQKAYQDF